MPSNAQEVHEAGDDGLNDGELRAEAEREQHDEEENGPQGRERETSHRLWVRHEGQPSAWTRK